MEGRSTNETMVRFRSTLVGLLVGMCCAHPSQKTEVSSTEQGSTMPASVLPSKVERAEAPQPISDAMAVARAEEFIRLNGYTHVPAVAPDKLTPESLEFGGAVEWGRYRHDTLQAEAYGYCHGRRGQRQGWTVIFCYSRDTGRVERPTGRAVTMNEDGSEMRVEHVDIFLDAAEKRLHACEE
jgi:hypothetical protein